MAMVINILKFLLARVVVYIFPLLVRFYWSPWTIKRALYFIKWLYLLNL